MFKSKTPQFFDQKKRKIEGSVATIEKIELGGHEQTIMIRGRDCNHPLLLFLHGGPGFAQIGFARHYQQELEKHFLVVNWDMRGTGKSFSSHLLKADMTIDQHLEDIYQLIHYLLEKFSQKRIFLAGHSWGSILGMLFAKKHPELLHAYIGIGQLSNVEKGELISYQHVLIHARQLEKRRAVSALQKLGYPPYQRTRDLFAHHKWVSRFGGDVRKGSIFRFLLRGVFSSEYTLLDWWRYYKGLRLHMRSFGREIMRANLFEEVEELSVPVYFCVGKYDYLSPHELQQRFFEHLSAPNKDLIWFENSAHCPHLEEPPSFLITMLRIKEELLIYKQKDLLKLKSPLGVAQSG
ncbi:alpha/beta fold hydrolase [Laceyella putida]|uniref:Alpha/beta fold hydrolase n=1 Tax=Laceyella putida TaxID=110101 RepID=A0ABW2RIE0_9BACL